MIRSKPNLMQLFAVPLVLAIGDGRLRHKRICPQAGSSCQPESRHTVSRN